MLAAIAARYGATHVETLTGFKWLARADSKVPGGRLVYAYEEAIGHCVDPAAVRDKDGISAAVLVCDMVAARKVQGRSLADRLDDLARRYGVHDVAAVSRPVADTAEAAELMKRLRTAPPSRLAGFAATITDIADALIVTAGDDNASIRVVVRPSGTEPKLKCYLEIRCAAADDLTSSRAYAADLRAQLLVSVAHW
jgi:phosphomannomutase